ncbi:MAG: hypothetical protein CMJ32_07475 [Phycisphaerae bacterium]|nr:hypothetical protein [Phycisphaerae bacterium]
MTSIGTSTIISMTVPDSRSPRILLMFVTSCFLEYRRMTQVQIDQLTAMVSRIDSQAYGLAQK